MNFGPNIFVCLIGIVGLISVVVWVMALVDVIRSNFKNENEKIIWVLVILLGGIIGAVLYYAIGKKNQYPGY